MGAQCSQLYDNLIGIQHPRDRIIQFNSKHNTQVLLSGLKSKNSIRPLPIQLHEKSHLLVSCSKQLLYQSSPQIVSYESYPQNLFLVNLHDKSQYKGFLHNKMRSIQGQQKWPDGTRYIGQWKQNLPHGNGIYISFKQGFTFQGKFQYGLVEGEGKYYGRQGQYQGQWHRNSQHGFGKEIWGDRQSYQGYYQNGHKHGKGIYKWADKSLYKGDWFQGRIQGQGKYVYQDGRTYQGQFVNNMMHGQGTYKWPDGRKYIGQYSNDKKQGYGRYYWTDGRYYEGQWINGKRNGYGKVVLANGTVKYGRWEEDKKVQDTQNPHQKQSVQETHYERQDQTKLTNTLINYKDKYNTKVPLYASSKSPYKNLKNHYQQYSSKVNTNQHAQQLADRYKFIHSPFKQQKRSYSTIEKQLQSLTIKERPTFGFQKSKKKKKTINNTNTNMSPLKRQRKQHFQKYSHIKILDQLPEQQDDNILITQDIDNLPQNHIKMIQKFKGKRLYNSLFISEANKKQNN